LKQSEKLAMNGEVSIDADTQRMGFETILDQCLELKPGSELLVIYDESFEKYFDALLQVIIDRDHRPRFSSCRSSIRST
jgi:hypothetical protein